LISSSRYAALLLPAVFFVCFGAAGAQSVMHRGDLTINSAAADVVVAEGNLVVKGEVTGSVFVVDGDMMMVEGSEVAGNVTVLGGSLWVSRPATVGGEINVLGGEAHIEQGANVASKVRAVPELPSLTPEKLSLVSRYIIFDRTTPPSGFDLSRMDDLTVEHRGVRKYGAQSIVRLDLFELGKAPLPMDRVEGTREVSFSGRGLRASVCVVVFKDEDAAAEFWNWLRSSYEERTSSSVHNSLGQGAHWFFRHEGASYCLWRRQGYLAAVMVRHRDDDPERDEWEEVEELRDKLIEVLRGLFNKT